MKEVNGHEKIENAVKKNFKKKYVEVYDTPMPHEPFLLWFGHDGLTLQSIEVLRPVPSESTLKSNPRIKFPKSKFDSGKLILK